MRLMKFSAALTVLTLAFSLAVLAKDSNSASFDLADRAQIGSTVLEPGHYKAEWTGSNDSLHISILKNGKTVATASGQLKELSTKAPYTSVSTKANSDNTLQVGEIDFDQRTEALMITGS